MRPTPDELFRLALNNHGRFIADAAKVGYSLDGMCQQTMRASWNGPRLTDPSWWDTVDVPYVGLPETATALQGAGQMAKHHDQMGWDSFDKSILGRHEGKYLVYFNGAWGTKIVNGKKVRVQYGHIAIVVFTAPGVGKLYDNAGSTREWSPGWARRVIGVYRPKQV